MLPSDEEMRRGVSWSSKRPESGDGAGLLVKPTSFRVAPFTHLTLAMREPCRRHASQICQPSNVPCHSGGRALAPRPSASWIEEGANDGVLRAVENWLCL